MAATSVGALVLTMISGGSASADSTNQFALNLPARYVEVCLDVLGASSANYTPVQIHVCNTTAAQKWTTVTAGNTVRAFGKCLDVEGGGTANGTLVDIYSCNGTGAQVWIHRSDSSLYNPQSGKCLDDPNASYTDTQVEIWTCNGGVGQHWSSI